ncbi:MAG: hypothetical protein PHR14_02670 [Oscillospiraceae bacterium]|nr:hypothetical protein [Oscillospiraceae bacterium]
MGVEAAEGEPRLHSIESPPVFCDFRRVVLRIAVSSLAEGSLFAVKVADGAGEPICLTLSREPGDYEFPLSFLTGLTPGAPIRVQLHALSGSGELLTVTHVDITEFTDPPIPIESDDYRWHPSYIVNTAHLKEDKLTSTDLFADKQTIIRHLSVPSGRTLLAGRCLGRCRLKGGELIMENGAWSAVLRLYGAETPAFYPTMADFFARRNAGVEPDEKTSVWSVRLDRPGDYFVVVRFNDGGVKYSLPDEPPDTAELIRKRQAELSGCLDSITFPVIREPDRIEAKDISAELLVRAYNTAWYHIISALLPPSPETGFAYGCMATGKASLWAYGAPACPYAASWETFYGLIMYARIDPGASWEMFRGYMELVEESGMLGGESLPSVKACTAWELYQLMPERYALAQVLPAIERYLSWRTENLRWIYLDITPHGDQKDLDFVASALVDMSYFTKLCRLSGMDEKAAHWDARRKELYAEMTLWFFPGDAPPRQIWYSDSGKSSPGHALTVTKALFIPELAQSEKVKLLGLFDSVFDPEKLFGGFTGVKLENMMYTIRGLCANGRAEQAHTLAQTVIRDIVRTGFFAEEYLVDGEKILPSGVRPSLFGCILLINCMDFMNGDIE